MYFLIEYMSHMYVGIVIFNLFFPIKFLNLSMFPYRTFGIIFGLLKEFLNS